MVKDTEILSAVADLVKASAKKDLITFKYLLCN